MRVVHIVYQILLQMFINAVAGNYSMYWTSSKPPHLTTAKSIRYRQREERAKYTLASSNQRFIAFLSAADGKGTLSQTSHSFLLY